MLRLLKQMKAKQWIMALLCVALILGQIYFDLRLPDYMSDLTVQIKTPGSTVSDVLHTGLEMLACTLISAVMAILCGYLNAQVAAGFSYHIRESVFQKVADFGQKEMLEFSVPSLINRTTNDITQIQMFVAMGMQTMIKAPVMAVWAVIKIVNKSWTLSVITAGFVVALLALMLIVVLVILPRVRRVQKLTDNINLISRENLTGISVVHAYNAEEYQEDKFEKANDVLMRTQLFNQRAMALLMPAVGLAMNALSLTIYWVGAAIVNRVSATDLAGRISTFGDIVVFGTYATYIIMSLMMLVMILVLLPMAQVSAVRINEVLDAPIAQAGANVSGGQKQRLSIARALARKPEILIFDDSFSALDYRTDASLRAGLARELSDTTCLIVAQRIGTIRHADRIVVLDEGRVAGIGTHDELMKNCSVYREIAMSQLSAAELEKEGV